MCFAIHALSVAGNLSGQEAETRSFKPNGSPDWTNLFLQSDVFPRLVSHPDFPGLTRWPGQSLRLNPNAGICGQESGNPTRVPDGKRQRQPIPGKETYTKEFSWFGNYGVIPIKSFQMVNMAEFCNARQRPCKLEKNNCLSYSMSFALRRHWWLKDDARR